MKPHYIWLRRSKLPTNDKWYTPKAGYPWERVVAIQIYPDLQVDVCLVDRICHPHLIVPLAALEEMLDGSHPCTPGECPETD
jgi:hypothetical protein